MSDSVSEPESLTPAFWTSSSTKWLSLVCPGNYGGYGRLLSITFLATFIWVPARVEVHSEAFQGAAQAIVLLIDHSSLVLLMSELEKRGFHSTGKDHN